MTGTADLKALRFNRNDKLNDMLEHSRSLDAGFDYYVSCFTHNYKESIPLWFMYAQKKGVRIAFNSKGIFKNIMYLVQNGEKKYFSYVIRGYDGNSPTYNNIYETDGLTIEMEKPLFKEVTYNDEMLKLKHTQKYGGGSINVSMTNVYQLATIKGTAWSFECESRYFLLSNGHYKFIDSIYIEFADEVFDDLEIVFSPFYTNDELISKQQEMVDKYPNIKFNFVKSCLYGKIQ